MENNGFVELVYKDVEENKDYEKIINLVVDKRKEEGKYGETHTLYVSQSKEEREAKYDKKYVVHSIVFSDIFTNCTSFSNKSDNYCNGNSCNGIIE